MAEGATIKRGPKTFLFSVSIWSEYMALRARKGANVADKSVP